MKNFVDSAIKSWKTTLVGLSCIGAGLYIFLTTKSWTEGGIAVTFGAGFICAKDGDQTHSIPPTNNGNQG